MKQIEIERKKRKMKRITMWEARLEKFDNAQGGGTITFKQRPTSVLPEGRVDLPPCDQVKAILQATFCELRFTTFGKQATEHYRPSVQVSLKLTDKGYDIALTWDTNVETTYQAPTDWIPSYEEESDKDTKRSIFLRKP